MNFRIRRPSPALFVASLALIVAMSGSAFAIERVTHGGDSLITQRTLSGNRLRLNTVTGAEVADLTWHNLTLINGWQNWYVTKRPPGWAIDVQGIVHLRGTINNPTASSTSFAVLPAAGRPKVEVTLAIALFGGQGTGAVAIEANGTMKAFGANTGQASLDGITYSPN